MYSNISAMWDRMKSDHQIKNKFLLECEPEVQEVLRRVDICVEEQKAVWEKQEQSLKARIDVREQECLILKTTLDQKHQEIGQLRCNLEEMEKAFQESQVVYEEQLDALKDEVLHLRQDYEKLQRKHQRQSKSVSSEKSNHSQDENKVKKLMEKLDNYRQGSLAWEHEKRTLQNQLQLQQSENQSLNENCKFLSQQLSGYKSQLDRWHNIAGNNEDNLNLQVQELHERLERAMDSINSQDKKIVRYKSLLEESNLALKRVLSEKEKLDVELRTSHQIIRKFEEEARETRCTMETQEQLIKNGQEENSALNHQIVQLQLSSKDKDTAEQSCESSLKDPSINLLQLQKDLRQAKQENKNSRKMEKLLHEEVAKLRQQLNQSNLECDRLGNELLKKVSEERNVETTLLKQLRNENFKLQKDLQSTKDAYQFDKDVMCKKEEKLNSEISCQSETITSLNSKVTTLEQQVHQYVDELSQEKAENEVIKAKLHAVKTETQTLLSTEKTKSDLQEIHAAYAESIKALELRNDRLEKDLSAMKTELRRIEENTQARIHGAISEREKIIRKIKDEENRRIAELEELSRRQVAGAEARFNKTIRQYEAKVEEQQKRIIALEDELELKNRSLTKFGRENEALSSFINGVKRIVKSPLASSSQSQSGSEIHRLPVFNGQINERTSARTLSSLPGDGFNDEDLANTVDSVDVTTEQFLYHQKAKSRELESAIDFYVDKLSAFTDQTIKQYSVSSDFQPTS